MKIICAWCGKDMGEKEPTQGKWKDEITHGMCEECYKKEIEEIENEQGIKN